LEDEMSALNKLLELYDKHYSIDDRITPDDLVLLASQEIRSMQKVIDAVGEWREADGNGGTELLNLIRAYDEYKKGVK
jgi:hypothetical protein